MTPGEVCNGEDDDCDGETDEGVANACGSCGVVPEEVCNFTDDDCDGQVDEGLRNACGACAQVAEERCNDRDDDCDGATDEDVLNACGQCGAAPEERCNFVDDDCDGQIDEGGLRNACGECGALVERCNGLDDDCDDETDEGLLNACGRCGDLPVEVCNGRDDDCDERVDEDLRLNRCGVPCVEEPVEVCNGLDDDCDGTLDEDLPVNACGECGPPPEEVCNGEDDDCDTETDEGFELNLCGGCGDAPVERCNGEDDDCDGSVDEDFRVGRSIDHCSGCGDACSRNNATPECINRRCVLVACDAGFRDENREVEDGCEVEAPPRGTIFVSAAADAGGDGTDERPFQTILRALEDIEPDTRVVVRPGVYVGVFAVSVVGVSIEGGPGVVIRPADDGRSGDVVVIEADYASLSRVRVDANGTRSPGIRLRCQTGCSAVGNEVVRVDGGSSVNDAHGIYVDGGDGVSVVDNLVQGVTLGPPVGRGHAARGITVSEARAVVSGNLMIDLQGGDGRIAGGDSSGGEASGIYLWRADGSVLSGNSVRGLQGGEGPTRATGGAAIGIAVHETNDLTIDGAGDDLEGEPATIRQLRGGLGGENGTAGYAAGVIIISSTRVSLAGVRVRELVGATGRPGANGGLAMGLYLEWVQGLQVTGMTVDELSGGSGGRGAPRGPTFGFLLGRELDDILVDETNLVEGEPGFVAYGVAGQVRVEGLHMREPVMTSNLGRIVLVDVVAPIVEGNHVVGPVGPAGNTTAVEDGATVGHEAVGIRLRRVAGAAIVRDNVIERATGGRGGSVNRRGGVAVGVMIEDCDDPIQVTGNTIRSLQGGPPGGDNVEQGGATGVWVANSALIAANNVVTTLEGSGSAGIFLDDEVRFADIYRNSFYDLRKTLEDSAASGVYVEAGPNRDIRVSDSVFEWMGWAVNASEGDARVDYIATREIGDEDIQPGVGNYGDHVIALEATCFVQALLGDFSLVPGSPCVDAGDPVRGCGEEPGGEACVPDLGHLASTAEARP